MMALGVTDNLKCFVTKADKYVTTGDRMQKRKVFFRHVFLGTGLAFYAAMNHMP